MTKSYIIILSLLVFFAIPSYAENLDAAAQQRAAEKGDARAQLKLGEMYDNGGGGVKEDYAAALKWYHKAADQGNAEAQFNIGWMYERGHGVKQNWEEAYFWYLLAEKSGFNFSSGNDYAAAAYKAVGMTLTPEQINVAKQRVQEWTSTHTHSVP